MKDGILIIKEIFWTVQGEGRFVGVPAIFIRLAGCSTKCRWCDTDWLKGTAKTFEQILDKVNALYESNPTHLIVITGGEPFDQVKNLIPFIKLITSHLYLKIGVSIETSVPASIKSYELAFDDKIYITASPKLFFEDYIDWVKRAKCFIEAQGFNELNLEFKFVIDSMGCIEKLYRIRRLFRLTGFHPATEISLMFEDSFLDTMKDQNTFYLKYEDGSMEEFDVNKLVSSCLNIFSGMNVRISPRLHKQLSIA